MAKEIITEIKIVYQYEESPEDTNQIMVNNQKMRLIDDDDAEKAQLMLIENIVKALGGNEIDVKTTLYDGRVFAKHVKVIKKEPENETN